MTASGIDVLGFADAYPFYEWKLHLQFDLESRPDIAGKLEGVCPFIRERDYFQTGLLLFDTNVAINTTTVDDIWELALAFPISKTNEQVRHLRARAAAAFHCVYIHGTGDVSMTP